MTYTKKQLEEIIEKQKRMMTNDRNFYLKQIKELQEQIKELKIEILDLQDTIDNIEYDGI